MFPQSDFLLAHLQRNYYGALLRENMFKTDGAKEYSAKSLLQSVFALMLSLKPCVSMSEC